MRATIITAWERRAEEEGAVEVVGVAIAGYGAWSRIVVCVFFCYCLYLHSSIL